MAIKQKHAHGARFIWRALALLLPLITWDHSSMAANTCAVFVAAPTRNTSLNLPYEIYNLGPAFQEFWRQAKGKPFQEQLKIWDRLIEAPYQRFYNALVWENDGNPDWFFEKYYQLQSFFTRLEQDPDLVTAMMQGFATFEEKVANNTAKFTKYFSDAIFPQAIYAAPAIKFDGKAYRDQVVGFGIDLIAEFDRKTFKHNPNVLYTHELFHIYHARAAQTQKYAKAADSPVFFLWQEGLATYFSQFMNQPTSLLEALSSKDLAQVSDAGVYWLAAQFIQEVKSASSSIQRKNLHFRWFNFYESCPNGPDIPPRSGYLLGYRVAQLIAKYYSSYEMAHWNPLQARGVVQQALEILAKQNTSIKKPVNFYRPEDTRQE